MCKGDKLFMRSTIKFTPSQLKEIANVLEALDTAVDVLQMEQIRLGLEDGLDVSIYAKPEFNPRQMEEIRLGKKNS